VFNGCPTKATWGTVHNSKTVASSLTRFELLWLLIADLDSSVIIVTACRLDGLGVESRWGRHFPHPSRLALGPIWPPVWWVPGLCWVKQLGRGIDHPPPSSSEVKERTELYLYFPSVPSWQVIGWSELWGYCLCGAFMQFMWLIHAASKNWKIIFKEKLLKFQDEFFSCVERDFQVCLLLRSWRFALWGCCMKWVWLNCRGKTCF
jgi:hypothetical protein